MLLNRIRTGDPNLFAPPHSRKRLH
jgi:hypothetical protein